LACCRSPFITSYYASLIPPGSSQLLIVMELLVGSVADVVSGLFTWWCTPCYARSCVLYASMEGGGGSVAARLTQQQSAALCDELLVGSVAGITSMKCLPLQANTCRLHAMENAAPCRRLLLLSCQQHTLRGLQAGLCVEVLIAPCAAHTVQLATRPLRILGPGGGGGGGGGDQASTPPRPP
jgi:hypothetical protein